jgi:hypothetical protein
MREGSRIGVPPTSAAIFAKATMAKKATVGRPPTIQNTHRSSVVISYFCPLILIVKWHLQPNTAPLK